MTDSPIAGMSECPEQFESPSNRRRWAWPLVLVLVAIGLAIGTDRFQNHPQDAWKLGPAIGVKLTQFELDPLTGIDAGLTATALTGKVTLLNFWGPWCHYCREEFPHLLQLESRLRSNAKFQFISVSSLGQSDADGAETRQLTKDTEEFLNANDVQIPTYRDRGARVRLDLMAKQASDGFGFPTTVVLDGEGTIRGFWSGYRAGDERQIQSLVEELLAR